MDIREFLACQVHLDHPDLQDQLSPLIALIATMTAPGVTPQLKERRESVEILDFLESHRLAPILISCNTRVNEGKLE